MTIKAIASAFFISITSITTYAQPTITNCENFSIGTVLKFQECYASSVYAGAGGSVLTWDFSSLTPLADTSTEWMVDPSTTTHGSLFPLANLVEKYSNGTFVYVHMNADSSFITGYVDTVGNFVIRYPNTVLFALRPITYATNVTDSFTTNFASSSYNFRGNGLATIAADGYGTLKLPNGTFTNTLRLKITQVENDTLIPSGTPSVTTSTSYVWFNNSFNSALLKIDSTQSGSSITKSVEYLIQESNAGVNTVSKTADTKIFPNPAKNTINISPCAKGIVSIINPIGQIMSTEEVDQQKNRVAIDNLPSGIFYFLYKTEAGTQIFQFTVLK